MKFGRSLPRNQVPEWASSYIDYKGLKKLIKVAAQETKAAPDGETDTAAFFYSLDRNLENVDSFYNKKFADCSRRLKLLQNQYQHPPSSAPAESLDVDEAEELTSSLLDLRSNLRKLQWYGEVNRRGFNKITKKLDKKVPNNGQKGRSQRLYMESMVDLKAFTRDASLLVLMNTINEWLANVGDGRVGSKLGTANPQALTKVPSRTRLKLENSTLEGLEAAVRRDDAKALEALLQQAIPSESGLGEQLRLNLLHRSISRGSRKSITCLLGLMECLEDRDDVNQRNCIHRFLLTAARQQQEYEMQMHAANGLVKTSSRQENQYITPASALGQANSAHLQETDACSVSQETPVQLLEFLLDSLKPSQQEALIAIDATGKAPLHYASQHGLRDMANVILRRLVRWRRWMASPDACAPLQRDIDGRTPLHLSVTGGHPETTRVLLHSLLENDSTKGPLRDRLSQSGELLSTATKFNYYVLVEILVQVGTDVNYQDEQGETSLHVGARFGHAMCVQALLKPCKLYTGQTINLEQAESTFGWTPLFIACVDGQADVFEQLIRAGADIRKADASGWTPQEHAALRGHLEIAKRLEEALGPSAPLPGTGTTSGAVTDRSSATPWNGSTPKTDSVKTFGHRYLIGETLLLVSMGSMDNRKIVPAVELDRIPVAEAHSTQLDTALSIVISAVGADGEPEVIDLPVQENISTEPIAFRTQDVGKVKLMFDVVPTYAGSTKKVIGRGVSALSSAKPRLGSKRMALQGDLSVPIIAAHNLEIIGTVNYNFLIVTPFTHPNMSITSEQTYWRQMASTMVIGHRGLGKNVAAKKSLQLGENTIQSFITAASLGATYVEFDVQLTKDHVPVIYHDFLVSETGIDAPVHTLTLEQFLHINRNPTPRLSRPPSPELTMSSSNASSASSPPTPPLLATNAATRPRSMSLGSETSSSSLQEMAERMKHTRDFKAKGFKANSRGHFIQEPFTTLEEMFRKLPPHIGFNIEMKYPMLFESEQQDMDPLAVELNSFVDAVLQTVYGMAKGRNVIFSSFNPDICLLLVSKQPSIPVLFLTDAGKCPVGDIRASSLQEAIRFANRWNLLGIVSEAEPLVMCPRLVRVVKESGLVCVSYGTLNNDTACVKRQVDQGIDAVIVDSVLAVRNGLTEHEQEKEKAGSGKNAAPSSG